MSKKIIIFIGEKDTTLALCSQSKIYTILENGKSEIELGSNIAEFLKQNSNIPILVFFDNNEQHYNNKLFPRVGTITLHLLAKRNLVKEFGVADIKGYRVIKKNKSKNAKSTVLFAGLKGNNKIKQWIDYLESIDNPVSGIYLFPMEVQSIIPFLSNKDSDNEKRLEIYCIVNGNKTLRQVAFDSGKFVFTRLTEIVSKNDIGDSVIAEIKNTANYLQHLITEDVDRHIFTKVIVENKYVANFSKAKSTIANQQIEIISINELTKLLNLRSLPEDISVNLALAIKMTYGKSIMKFITKVLNIKYLLETFRKFYVSGTAALAIYLITISLLNYQATPRLKTAIGQREISRGLLNKAIDRQKLKIGDITDVDIVRQIVAVYNFTSNQIDFESMVKKLSNITNDDIYIKEIQWKCINNCFSPSQYKVYFATKMVINNESGYFDDLEVQYDDLTIAMYKQFKGYKLDYDKLPTKISFSRKYNNFPINLNGEGPY